MRTFLQTVLMLSCLVILGARTNASAQFALGADMSWLKEAEDRGQKYYTTSGVVGDGLAIVKSLGVNAIRLRTWINPTNGHCSQKETIMMAMRCKKLGLRVMIDFHYHNSWVSVGERHTPKEWANMDYPTMCKALYDYAYGFCKELKDSGVTPEWFQNGNETNGGLCPPTGELSKNPVQMTGLFNKGYEAIHAVFPFPATKVMIHVAQPQKTEGAAMVRTYIANGGKLDALGWSTYASTGNVDGIIENVKTWQKEFPMETYVVEFGTKEAPDKQKLLTEKWNAGIGDLNKACEGGIFYWEPDGYGIFNNPDALFDATGHPTAGWDGYKAAPKKPCTIAPLANRPSLISSAQVNRTARCSWNPVSKTISIQLDGRFNYSVFDLTGKELLYGSAHTSTSVGHDLKAGVYFVRLSNLTYKSVAKISVNRAF